MAEVEIPDIDATVEILTWAGEEVTPDPRRYNANLSTRPFQTWAMPAAEESLRAE